MNNPGDFKNRRSLSQWIFRTVCAVLIVAWLIAQFAARTDGLEYQFEDQLQRLSDVTTAGKARVHSRVDGYGWPINTFFVQTDHWFAVWPGQPPQPVRASRQSGLSSDQSYVYFTYIHRDPTVNTLFTIIWPQIVLQIGLLIAVIAGIGVLFHAIESIVNTIQARRLRRRVATQS